MAIPGIGRLGSAARRGAVLGAAGMDIAASRVRPIADASLRGAGRAIRANPRRAALGGGIVAGGAVGAGYAHHRSAARDGLQGRSSGGFMF